MQKIKEEKGITLAILIVTVIVLLIVVGVTMDMGFDAADSAEDSNKKSELQMVGQATISEYTKAIKLNYIKEDDTIPANFIGEVITGKADDLLPTLPSGAWALSQSEAVGYKSYFRLTPEELDKLNISNTTDTYVINYYTGEVYNETQELADDGSVLYLKLNNAVTTNKETDTTSFVDEAPILVEPE